MAFLDFLRKRCPACGQRGLRSVGGVLVNPQRPIPKGFVLWWTDYNCPKGAGLFRQDMDQDLRPLTRPTDGA